MHRILLMFRLLIDAPAPAIRFGQSDVKEENMHINEPFVRNSDYVIKLLAIQSLNLWRQLELSS